VPKPNRIAIPATTNAVRRNLGPSDSRTEYANATSIVNKGPSNRVGKLYPTDSEALQANSSASNATGTFTSPRAVPFKKRYSTMPSTIPKTPKDTVARLARYSPSAISVAGIIVSTDAPTYLDIRLVPSSGTALA